MRTKKFSLIELLVVIGIIGLLAAMAFPAYNMVRNKSQTASCTNNLKQIGICINAYAMDNNDYLPVCERLEQLYGLPVLKDLLSPYSNGNVKIFVCPADKSVYIAHGTSYEWNSFINGLKIDKNKFLVGNNLITAPFCGDASAFHNKKMNYLYPEGRVSDSYEVQIQQVE